MLTFLPYYLLWHYSRALSEMYHVWGNILWFFYNFFSIPLLLSTLFAPFKRLDEGYKKGLHVEAFFETLIVNMLMRLVGAFMRVTIISVGIIVLALVCVGYVFVLVAWLLAPLLALGLFTAACVFLFL